MPEEIADRESPWLRRGFLVVLAIGVAAAYSNSLHNPFVFDDPDTVQRNASIRHLWDIKAFFHSVPGASVQGRPFVNFTLALNYAIGGDKPVGYHVVNLLIHLANTLLLFGVVRRTLLLPGMAPRYGRASARLAFAAALLWGVHPLTTAVASYTSERTESLMSFFLLLTLYSAIRSVFGPRWPWYAAAVVASLCGMATKEVMVVAPLVVLFYDRAFLSNNWRQVFRERGLFYVALAATWTVRAALLAGNTTRGGAAGFGGGISTWDYLLTQCKALVIYLKLSVWPHPQVFDYGTAVVTELGDVWWQALLVVTLLATSVGAFIRRPALGFLAVVWFLILAPSSSVVPLITQTIGEHRVYLPLAAIIVGLVMFAFECVRKMSGDLRRRAGWALTGVVILLAAALGSMTWLRNRDYSSEWSLWADVIRQYPSNARAYNVRGKLYNQEARFTDAIAEYERAIQLQPDFAAAYYNRGLTYASLGRPNDAIGDFNRCLELDSSDADVYFNRALAYASLGRLNDAIADFDRCIERDPGGADAYYNRGTAYSILGLRDQAIADYTTAIRLDPHDPRPYINRGVAYNAARHPELAIADYDQAIKLAPGSAEVFDNRGNAYRLSARYAQAIADYSRAIELQPRFALAYNHRGITYMMMGDYNRAWADVATCRSFGGTPNPKFVGQLVEASGRTQ